MLPESASDPEPRTFSTSAGIVTYTDEGEGPAVVALHGAPGSLRDWRWLGPGLEGRLRLIRMDLPGFGATPLRTFSATGFEERADWLVEVLQGLGVESFAVMGHSVGGPLAMTMAARHPDRIYALALLASVGLRPHKPFRRFPRMTHVSPYLRVPVLKTLLTGIIRRGFRAAGFPEGLSGETIRQCMHIVGAVDFQRFGEILATVRQPTLVAWAEDDALIDTPISVELGEQCPPGPRISYAEGGHNLQKSHAVELAEQISTWITDMQPG